MNPHLLPLLLGKKSLAGAVIAILRKYGTDAHVYLPGIGVINGLTAGNYLDSAGVTPATVDNPVGLVLDANGTIDALQATTANKPILRNSGGSYSWQFDGTDSLALGSVPFQMADDHFVIVGASCSSYTVARTIFGISSTVNGTPLLATMSYQTDGAMRVTWRNDAGGVVDINSLAIPLNETSIFTARKVGTSKSLRKNGVNVSAPNTTDLGTTFTLNTANIGYLLRTTATNYHLGSMYPQIIGKGTITDADLLILEKWVGSLSGVSF